MMADATARPIRVAPQGDVSERRPGVSGRMFDAAKGSFPRRHGQIAPGGFRRSFPDTSAERVF
jgi:hypothetical protein